jgi:hypothetical protein
MRFVLCDGIDQTHSNKVQCMYYLCIPLTQCTSNMLMSELLQNCMGLCTYLYTLSYVKQLNKSRKELSALCHIYNRFDYLIPLRACMRKWFVPGLSLGELILETQWSWHEYVAGLGGVHTADQSSRPGIKLHQYNFNLPKFCVI